MNNKLIATALFAILTTMSLSAVNAEEKRRGPPAEAFAACTDKAAADSCSFEGNRGEVSGTCEVPKRGDEALICAPEGGRPPQ